MICLTVSLTLSIPQMVGASPCRSSDGMLFVGSKLDSWVAVDPATGHRKDSLEVEKNESTCSIIEDAIYIGRTEYVLSMIKEHKRWNVVYSTYSVTPSASDSSSALHLASPSNGKILR
jgi:serine/threonine-protein kinase/endoribonuclease IRE1